MPWQWVRSSQEKQIASMTNAQMQNAAAGRIAPLPWKTGFHMQVGAKKSLVLYQFTSKGSANPYELCMTIGH